jgi:diacylglycerol kinase family enzyme
VQPTVLFANPSAQSGKVAEWITRARVLLNDAGIHHDFVPTEPGGRTISLVREAVDEGGARRVIYMGGDGTFAEIAKGVLGSRHAPEVVMGMLPTGTANDQGKSFGLDSGLGALERNVSVIAQGRTTRIDVGRIERLGDDGEVLDVDLFFDSASIGFGAAALATRNRDRQAVQTIPVVGRIYRDQLVYAGALLQRLAESYVTNVKFGLEAEIDGTLHYFVSLLDVIIKNTHVFGGEWVLSPDAEADDGVFELVPIAGRTDLTSKLLSTLRHSPVTEEELTRLGIEYSPPVRGRRFVLTVLQPEGEKPPAAQIDDEEFPAGRRFTVEVLRRTLTLIVPRLAAR